MIAKTTIGIVLVAALCFGGSLVGTVAMRSQGPAGNDVVLSPIADRLGLNPEQAESIKEQDPVFAEELGLLQGELHDARSQLAATFEKEDAGDDEIRQRVEAVIEAHNRVERRVAEYLITVRGHLTAQQQKQLYGLCAAKVRECSRKCCRDCSRWGKSGSEGCRRGGAGHGPGRRHGGDGQSGG